MQKKKKTADPNIYYRVLVLETLENLGKNVHDFRHMGGTINKTNWAQDIPVDLLFLIDTVYQQALDNIIDQLANASDLKVATTACEGLEKSVKVRRGLCKKTDVY